MILRRYDLSLFKCCLCLGSFKVFLVSSDEGSGEDFATDSSESCAIHFLFGKLDSRPRPFSCMWMVTIRVCSPPYFALSIGFAKGILRGSRCSMSLLKISDTPLRTSTMRLVNNVVIDNQEADFGYCHYRMDLHEGEG